MDIAPRRIETHVKELIPVIEPIEKLVLLAPEEEFVYHGLCH